MVDKQRHPRATAKEIREARAYQIYDQHPDWGYRKVAKVLREEFGGALRDSELAKIKVSQPTYTSASELKRMKQATASFYFTQNPNMTVAEVSRKLKEEFGHSTSDLSRIKLSGQMKLSMSETLSEFHKKQTIFKDERKRVADEIARMPPVSAGRGMTLDITKADYTRRATTLSREGFFRWEWEWLAYHMITSDGMEKMREDRRWMVSKMLGQGLSWREIEAEIIRKLYGRDGFTFHDGRFNPFALLDWYKIRNQPSPETPQKKHRWGVVNKDFMAGKKNSRGRVKK